MRLRIVTSAANCKQFGPLLTLHPNIAIEVSASDDLTFFQEISAADALLLPVNFDDTSVDFIRYSMPTKVPAYLNSGTPVLAYGSPETAQIRYAADAGWGRVVTERSLALLKDALKQIVCDKALRGTLSAAARQAAANHDARVVRSDFQELLCRNAKR
jgi:glycosyltransferase involved in cell wall biosynthesis